jgi:hypothetical protein
MSNASNARRTAPSQSVPGRAASCLRGWRFGEALRLGGDARRVGDVGVDRERAALLRAEYECEAWAL